jgi:hypothetical protein
MSAGAEPTGAPVSAMRPRHEIVAGLGTMGSLVTAIACVFALAGGVVAFHGWPELESVGSGPSLVVSEAPRAPLQVTAVRPSRSHPAPAGQVAGNGRVAHAQRRVIASAPQRSGNGRSTVSARPVTEPKPAAKSEPSSGPLAPVADTTEQTTNGLGQTVTDTTGALGSAVGGPLGKTVTNLGSGLGETVTKTGTLVANLLRAIQPGR